MALCLKPPRFVRPDCAERLEWVSTHASVLYMGGSIHVGTALGGFEMKLLSTQGLSIVWIWEKWQEIQYSQSISIPLYKLYVVFHAENDLKLSDLDCAGNFNFSEKVSLIFELERWVIVPLSWLRLTFLQESYSTWCHAHELCRDRVFCNDKHFIATRKTASVTIHFFTGFAGPASEGECSSPIARHTSVPPAQNITNTIIESHVTITLDSTAISFYVSRHHIHSGTISLFVETTMFYYLISFVEIHSHAIRWTNIMSTIRWKTSYFIWLVIMDYIYTLDNCCSRYWISNATML